MNQLLPIITKPVMHVYQKFYF